MILKRNCSLCGQSNFRLKYKLKKFNILSCYNCGLLTRDVIFNKKEIKELYSKNYFCKLQKDYFSAGFSKKLKDSLRVKDFKGRLDKIKEYGKIQKKRILDIGCATGIFLKICKDEGWDTYGVEISNFAGEFARKTYDLKIFIGELYKTKYKSNFFDVTTGWDLIEHVEDPVKLLEEIKRILKPGGYIALETTMVDSLLFIIADIVYRITFGKFKKLVEIAYPIHHANHFSRKTLETILKKLDFKIVKKENLEIFYEETSLPKISLPILSMISTVSIATGKTIEFFVLAQKK